MNFSKRQYDLFVPTRFEPSYRDLMDVMAYGFLSLSKRRIKPITYFYRSVSVQVTANATYGMATIWDWDVIIGLVSLINESQNDGLRVSPKIGFRPYNLLKCIGKAAGGQNYRELAAAIRRLRYTSITTNIRLNDQHGEERPLSFVEDYKIPRCYADTSVRGMWRGTPDASQEWEVTISPWVFNVVISQKGILTIDAEYFRLKGGLERFLYRYARKAVPARTGRWKIHMELLHKASGSCGNLYDFEKKIRNISANDTLPGYRLETHGRGRESVVFFFVKTDAQQPLMPSLGDVMAGLDDFIPY